ncbi:LmbE family N-acetylglucosaminyl deacetylase [Promicromonospora sp. AC04]|uniref:PIG-L deacetylase family protein n=1 Tax=Promicromonospora sp. AC04 TaxID=2135723 RepID=UPI000D3479C0|nr:PIG-L family deacetylase [Promicromonospora sp. AC04]PUB23436.1 LmbE family N-acetylglucosaminyl deacetylase [Promicromonospora sp. AC04]
MRATVVIDVAPAPERAPAEKRLPPPQVRRLLVVCSTPFDVTFALGGVIAAFAAAGTAVQIVCLTHGRRPDPGTRRRLDRATELLQAARLLGAQEATLLDHRAGHLHTNPPETLASELRSVAGPVDAVLTVDAGAPGAHPDHVQAMRAAQHAAATLHCPLYGWTRPSVAAGATSGTIAVDSDRVRQQAAIACHGTPAADDPVHALVDLGQPRDYLTLL